MKYTEKNQIGDAGEHYFSYKIIQMFKSPCRLQNIDIGIDAVIELINQNEESTGEFIFVQIKTSKNETIKHTIKLQHLLYWDLIKHPVILVGVSLYTENIFIIDLNDKKTFTDLKDRAFKSINKEVSIEFDTYKNCKLFDDIDYNTLLLLRFNKIKERFTKLLVDLDSSLDHMLKYENINNFDAFTSSLSHEPVINEAVYTYILSLDDILYYSPIIESYMDEYNVPSHIDDYNEILDNVTSLEVEDVLKKIDTCFNIIDDLNDFMDKYICANEFRNEIVEQYFKNDYTPIKTPEAKELYDKLLG